MPMAKQRQAGNVHQGKVPHLSLQVTLLGNSCLPLNLLLRVKIVGRPHAHLAHLAFGRPSLDRVDS